MADFASRLKLLRKDKGIRQVDLAEEIGVAQTTIANYEQHIRFPDEETLRKLASYFEVSLDFLLGQSDTQSSSPRSEPGVVELGPMAKKYLSLLLKGSREKAGTEIIDMVEGGVSVREMYRNVFEPALKEVGRLWEIGELDVAKEHYFSEATEELMSRLTQHLKPAKRKRGVIVCLSASGEFHHIGIKMISHILEEEGWECYYLGVQTPTAALIKTIEERKASVLAISATMPFNVDSVANTVFRIRASFGKEVLKIVAGGRAFNIEEGLWKRIGADGFAGNLDDAVCLLNDL